MPTASLKHAAKPSRVDPHGRVMGTGSPPPMGTFAKDARTDCTLERKGGAFEVKALDDAGNFSIYMGIFGNVDRGGDILEPGACTNLDEYVKAGWVGINHNMENLPVAYVTSATQDDKGLLISGRFHTTPEAQACRTVVKERMAAGKRVLGSIGYKVNPNGAVVTYQDGQAIRRLKSIAIFESSFVNLPMNPAAEAVSAKSAEGSMLSKHTMTLDELKTWMDQQTKAGRTLSKDNHAVMKDWHAKLDTVCTAMKSFLTANDPSGPPAQADDADSSLDTAGKDLINQRNAAGNSIPADQNPHGAMTADDLRARKAESLQKLRDRAVRDQINFAMLSR